ncbi:hypothetical protein [Methanobacterium sp.]|uniref:hypothetical protein n=1 Tax=Methanobacterium sp. TaxID=2164 RepID=UPI003C776351
MIRNISYELLDNEHITTDILIKFEDKSINKDFYDFIKGRLDDFKLDLNDPYSITIDSKYDDSKNIILIDIVLSILDTHKPSDAHLVQIINDKTYKFIKFYERNTQLFKNNL